MADTPYILDGITGERRAVPAGRCKDCEHWGTRRESSAQWYGPLHAYRLCHVDDAREYAVIAEDEPLNNVVAQSEGDWMGKMATGPEFGCVKWTVKK